MWNARFYSANDSFRNASEDFKYSYNSIETLFVLNKKGEKEYIAVTPDLQIKVTLSSDKKDFFFFDTVFIVNDTLIDGKKQSTFKFSTSVPLSFDSAHRATEKKEPTTMR